LDVLTSMEMVFSPMLTIVPKLNLSGHLTIQDVLYTNFQWIGKKLVTEMAEWTL
jgi:hypothetical protein